MVSYAICQLALSNQNLTNWTHYRNAYIDILTTARFEILGRTTHEARNLTLCRHGLGKIWQLNHISYSNTPKYLIVIFIIFFSFSNMWQEGIWNMYIFPHSENQKKVLMHRPVAKDRPCLIMHLSIKPKPFRGFCCLSNWTSHCTT